MLNIFGLGYNESKLKPNFKMASQRIKMLVNKKSTSIKLQKREIAKLLDDGKEEKARIKVEGCIRDDFTIEALEIIELLCELLHERVKYISSNEECPSDIKEAVFTLIWSANKIDISELEAIKSQFGWKYGSKFVKLAEDNVNNIVNERIVNKLSVKPPSADIVIAYLKEIAKEYNLNWTPTEIGLPVSLNSSAIPAPSGFSVPMAPGSGLTAVYQDKTNNSSLATSKVLSQSEIRSQIESLTIQTQNLQDQLALSTNQSNLPPQYTYPYPNVPSTDNCSDSTNQPQDKGSSLHPNNLESSNVSAPSIENVNSTNEVSSVPSFEELEARFAALRNGK